MKACDCNQLHDRESFCTVRLGLLSLISLGVLLGACAGKSSALPSERAAARGLRGVVTYRQRIALAAGARVIVQLADISRGDADAMVIARQELRTQGEQVPIRFALAVEQSGLTPGRRYVVHARIEEGGQLRFLNHAPVALDPGRWPETLEVVVEPVR